MESKVSTEKTLGGEDLYMEIMMKLIPGYMETSKMIIAENRKMIEILQECTALRIAHEKGEYLDGI